MRAVAMQGAAKHLDDQVVAQLERSVRGKDTQRWAWKISGCSDLEEEKHTAGFRD